MHLARIGEGGSVVNAASIAGLQGIAKSRPYVASKVRCQLARSHYSLRISISNDCFSMVLLVPKRLRPKRSANDKFVSAA